MAKLLRIQKPGGGFAIARRNGKRVTNEDGAPCCCGGTVGGPCCLVTPYVGSAQIGGVPEGQQGCVPQRTVIGRRFRVGFRVDNLFHLCGMVFRNPSTGATIGTIEELWTTTQAGNVLMEFDITTNPQGQNVFRHLSTIQDTPLSVTWRLRSTGDPGVTGLDPVDWTVTRLIPLAAGLLERLGFPGFTTSGPVAIPYPVPVGQLSDPFICNPCDPIGPSSRFDTANPTINARKKIGNGWTDSNNEEIRAGLTTSFSSGFGVENPSGGCDATWNSPLGPFGYAPGIRFVVHTEFPFISDNTILQWEPTSINAVPIVNVMNTTVSGNSVQQLGRWSQNGQTPSVGGFANAEYRHTLSWETLEGCDGETYVGGPECPGAPASLLLPDFIDPLTLQPRTQPGRCQGCGN